MTDTVVHSFQQDLVHIWGAATPPVELVGGYKTYEGSLTDLVRYMQDLVVRGLQRYTALSEVPICLQKELLTFLLRQGIRFDPQAEVHWVSGRHLALFWDGLYYRGTGMPVIQFTDPVSVPAYQPSRLLRLLRTFKLALTLKRHRPY